MCTATTIYFPHPRSPVGCPGQKPPAENEWVANDRCHRVCNCNLTVGSLLGRIDALICPTRRCQVITQRYARITSQMLLLDKVRVLV